MCFLNPKYIRTFELKVCTAHGTRKEFNKAVNDALLKLVEFEIELNKTSELRWCIEENPVD